MASSTGAGGAAGQGGMGQGGMTSSSSSHPSSSSSKASSTAAGMGGMGGGGGAPTPADLLALTQSCNQVSNGFYAPDSGETANIPICGLTGAVYWKADMDIDCDGKMSMQCNINADPDYQDQTSAVDSHGDPLDSANLPFVVVPLASSRFDYKAAGLKLGSVILVIYNGKLNYGVFGDEGPSSIIGEASYAMANSLGIDPDPSTGGVDSGVTYIAFTGAGAIQSPIEDHDGAVTLGQSLARKLIDQN
jgi:Fungal chitosanase of glycosyl hydrolase group 75